MTQEPVANGDYSNAIGEFKAAGINNLSEEDMATLTHKIEDILLKEAHRNKNSREWATEKMEKNKKLIWPDLPNFYLLPCAHPTCPNRLELSHGCMELEPPEPPRAAVMAPRNYLAPPARPSSGGGGPSSQSRAEGQGGTTG
jgi:hypothetical protein